MLSKMCALEILRAALISTELGRFDFWLRNSTQAPSIAQTYAAVGQVFAAILTLVVNVVLVCITFSYATNPGTNNYFERYGGNCG